MAILSPIGNLFGRSPIGPIQEHMALADQAAQLLPALFRAMAADDWDSAKQVHKDIVSAESEADKMKRSVRKHLPNNLFLPVPRSDLLTLVGIQDHVANTAKDIGLVHEVVPGDDLTARGNEMAQILLANGPKAMHVAKNLIYAVANIPISDAVIDDTAHRIADQRASVEGREGVSAFLEKRPANWSK